MAGETSQQEYGLEGMGTSAARLFAAIMAQANDFIYIKDMSSRFIAISQSLADEFGLASPKEAVGKTDFDFFKHEHAQEAFNDEQRILKTGVPLLNKEEQEFWPDGRITWASTSKAPLTLGSGKIVGLMGISRDVTRQHDAQQALEESRRQLKERDEHIRKDLQSARHVQEVFIPGDIPEVAGLKTSLCLKPMDAVGGDIITFPESPEGGLLFFLGDVTGHGVTAALFTLLVKYLTDRQGENYEGNPQEFLDKVNKGLIGRIPDGFVAGACGHFMPKPEGGARLFASNAGQPEFICYRHRDEQVELIKLPMGNVLGLPLEAGSKPVEYDFEPGDRVLFYTDGIIEMANAQGEEFGVGRTQNAFRDARKYPIEEVADHLIDTARKFSGQSALQDDLSLLIIEVE